MKWFTGENDIAISIFREAKYLISSGSQEDKYNIRHSLALALRDSKNNKDIEEALEFFLENEEFEKITDTKTIDKNLSGYLYGNVGRCLQFNTQNELALNCYLKSFFIIFIREQEIGRPINLGYAAKWISEILFETNEPESGFYFLRYASEMWGKCSPPLSNKCKLQLSKLSQSSTIKSILSLEFWQIERYCKSFIKKKSDLVEINF